MQKDIIITDTNGNPVLGTISIPKKAKSVVIISHGFSSNKNSKLYVELQNELNKIGIGTLRYDYYGHGKLYLKNTKYTVTNDVTLSKCVASLKTMISFINTKGNYEIGLIGASFGGLLSIIAAAQEPTIKALATKSAVVEPINFWRKRLGDARIKKWKQNGTIHYNDLGENFELNYTFWSDLLEYNIFKMAHDITSPILIIHGGNDTVVPIKQSYDLAKILNTEVNVVEGANHDYATPKQYATMKNLIISFFKKAI